MKELFWKGGLFLVGGLVWLHVLAFAAGYLAPDGSTFFLSIDRENVNQLLANASIAETIIVGNSHGDDVLASELASNGYQLSRAWGDFFEIAYYLENLVPRLPNLKVVIIPVSYFSFGWDNPSAPNLDVRRVDMYSVIPSFRMLPGDLQYYFIGKGNDYLPVKSILREDNWAGIFYSLLNGDIRKDDPSEVTFPCKPLDKETLDDHARTRALDQIKRSLEISRNRPSVDVDAYSMLERSIQYLQERGIRVVLFTPPYYETYHEIYLQEDPNAIRQMKENIEKLKKQYSIEYYDFSTDKEFITHYELYKDSDLLNECGARLFSQKLNKILFP